jgi:diguanylate cyclase (GGDEF)-like protein
MNQKYVLLYYANCAGTVEGSMRVLIIDDSQAMRELVAAMISEMGHEPVVAAAGAEGLTLFDSARPDLVLLDVEMPGLDGYETARRMREASHTKWVPIIFLSGGREDQDLNRAIQAGGDDYLVKPCSEIVLAAKIRAMQRLGEMRRELLETSQKLAAANSELEHQTRMDSLTGIANRRHLEIHLGTEFKRAVRTHSPLAVLLCDVDHFKLYNDRYGHPAGDECLRQVARLLVAHARRPSDLAARYGGEEFSVVMPDTPLERARTIAWGICEGIAKLRIPHEASKTGAFVTISVGGACGVPTREASVADFLKAADVALYRAKDQGRNRVTIIECGESTPGLPAPEKARASAVSAPARSENPRTKKAGKAKRAAPKDKSARPAQK